MITDYPNHPTPVTVTAAHPEAGAVEMNVYGFTNIDDAYIWFVAFRSGNHKEAEYVETLLASQDVLGVDLGEHDIDQELALDIANEFLKKQVKIVTYAAGR
jgi:hypothetical protein